MVTIPSLWLPILISTVLVFLASWIIHVLLPIHRKDFGKMPAEDAVMETIRKAGAGPGDFCFPCPETPAMMRDPAYIERYTRGPVGFVTLLPTGPPAMGGSLAMWFVYCAAIGTCAAYLASRTLDPATHYLEVFRVSGTAAFLGYAGAQPIQSIWMKRKWSTTVKSVVDGLVYSLLTAGTFGWLWPR